MDFDTMCKLAQTNIGEFERKSAEMIEELITSAPARLQPKLRETQSMVENLRKLEDGNAMNVAQSLLMLAVDAGMEMAKQNLLLSKELIALNESLQSIVQKKT